MTTATITRTREYLVIKIPLREVKSDEASKDKEAVFEGLRAVKEGRVSETFHTSREAIKFLRKL